MVNGLKNDGLLGLYLHTYKLIVISFNMLKPPVK